MIWPLPRLNKARTAALVAGCLLLAGLTALRPVFLRAQDQAPKIVWTSAQRPIVDRLDHLRDLPDDARARATKVLALQIRKLPASENKVTLADDLANLSTEGDFGRNTLQEVTTTLATALRDNPVPADKGQPAEDYLELAQLVRYEHMQASLDDPQFAAATSKLEADDARRQGADFTLLDLHGNPWTLKQLRGKVVLVNFWATWCPPCRKEIPALESLYNRFQDQGFVILAVSDDDPAKIAPFIAQQAVTYPVLLDPEKKVSELFQVDGIPKSFVYDRSGNLVAQSIDMRTQSQFLAMLAAAGLK